jgi:1-phosphofructokinase
VSEPPAERPPVAVFGPHPLLTVTIERRGDADDIHVHAGGQGVWVSRMAGELGAAPVLCGLAGGETGAVLERLLEALPGERRLVRTAGSSGCYVVDRRDGERRGLAQAIAPVPSRHELDELLAAAVTAALSSRVLVIGNAFPGDALGTEVYGALAADVRAARPGLPVLADLSSPRVEAVLPARPHLVKLNDWELAEYVCGPVDPPDLLLAAARRLREEGAERVLVTRGGEPALWLDGDEPRLLIPPRFERGAREGCGDTMMGAIAAMLARGRPMDEAIVTGAAAGAANFLHTGLGTGERAAVERLVPLVRIEPYPAG